MSKWLDKCPLCGSEAHFNYYWTALGGFKYFGVNCEKCPCNIEGLSSERLAAKVWNNRPSVKEAAP